MKIHNTLDRILRWFRLKKTLWDAKKKGAENGRREQPSMQLGNNQKGRPVPPALEALEKDINKELTRYPDKTAPLRAAIQEQVAKLKAKIGPIEALDKQLHLVFPPRVPILRSRFLLAGDLLLVIVTETVLTKMALGAIPGLSSSVQWGLAFVIGLFLAGLTLVAGEALAYLMRHSDQRDTDQYRLTWRLTAIFTALGIAFILILPYWLTVNREENGRRVLQMEKTLDELSKSNNITGHTEENKSAADQPQMTTDPGTQEPNVTWTFWLQEAALLLGILFAMLWFLGQDYRRHLKEVVGGYSKLEEGVAKAREKRAALIFKDKAILREELANLDKIRATFGAAERSGAAKARKSPPEPLPPPDHGPLTQDFLEMTERPWRNLDREIEEILSEIRKRIEQLSRPPERRAIEQGEHAESEGEAPPSVKPPAKNGKGQEANLPPLDAMHHDSRGDQGEEA